MDWRPLQAGATLTPACAIFGALSMKRLGFVLLLAGWLIVLAAIVLLPSAAVRAAFAISGIAVEILGFALVAQAHLSSPGELR